MERQPDFTRFLAAVQRREPDWVPLAEIFIDLKHQSQFLGRPVAADDLASQVEFWHKAGYDYVPITVGMMTPGKVTENSAIIKVIREVLLKDSGRADDESSWNIEYNAFVADRADFEKFPWEIAGELDFSALEEVKKYLPPGMKVIAMSGKIFTLTWMLMGFDNFSTKLIMDEDLVADVFSQIAKIQFKALERILDQPHVGAVWVVDDVAFGSGPMISPRALKDHVFSWYAQVAARCHARGMPLLMHSDGNVEALLPDLIAMGLDGFHPIDPNCMDIVKIKERFGSDLCLLGNVSNELLRSGSPREVQEKVRFLLENVAPGGGFCLGSGNSVPDWAAYDNYQAMRESALKWGKYPIKI